MKFIKKLIEKVKNYLDDNISKHPQNIYIGNQRYTRQELGLDEKNMEAISDEVKLIRKQREVFGIRDSENPLDDKDKIIERATKNHLEKLLAEDQCNSNSGGKDNPTRADNSEAKKGDFAEKIEQERTALTGKDESSQER